MNYGEAFTFIAKDEDWLKKLAIGAVFALLAPLLFIGLLPLLGWSLEIARRVIDGEEPVLPEWSNIGGLFVSGIKLIVVYFVWMLPMILLSGITAAVSFLLEDAMAGSDAPIVTMVCSGCAGLIGLVYMVLFGILAPGAFGELAATGSLGQALNPANALAVLKANPAGSIIGAILGGIVPSLAQSLGTLICVVGMLPAMAYGMAFMGHLYGQVYREAKAGAV